MQVFGHIMHTVTKFTHSEKDFISLFLPTTNNCFKIFRILIPLDVIISLQTISFACH